MSKQPESQYKAVIFDMYQTLVTVFNQKPYYSALMAEDAGVPVEQFRRYWRTYEQGRTLGDCNLSAALEGTLLSLGIHDPELIALMTARRLADQQRIYADIHPDILAMLRSLKSAGLRIGLVSNCYFEERDCIRVSALAEYFDVMMLSCEQHLRKPDPEIYQRCMDALQVTPVEALYVGDGGSRELETASQLGLTPIQACWFIHENEPDQPCGRLENYIHAESPQEILSLLSMGI